MMAKCWSMVERCHPWCVLVEALHNNVSFARCVGKWGWRARAVERISKKEMKVLIKATTVLINLPLVSCSFHHVVQPEICAKSQVFIKPSIPLWVCAENPNRTWKEKDSAPCCTARSRQRLYLHWLAWSWKTFSNVDVWSLHFYHFIFTAVLTNLPKFRQPTLRAQVGHCTNNV